MKRKKKSAIINTNFCVACGECSYLCPMQAIVINGIYANVNENICVGCGKCIKSCPANAISLKENV